MMKKSKIIGLLGLLIAMLFVVAGCGKSSNYAETEKSTLHGVYKLDDKYSKADDGTSQPGYWYFKKNGKLLRCEPQVTAKDPDNGSWYGEAERGTWKSTGRNKYQLKFHDVYDDDYFTIKAKVKGQKLITYSNSKNAKYKWNYDENTKIDMTYSDYMSMFNKAKESDQKGIQEDGYTKPDNDSSSDSTSSDNNSNTNDNDSSQQINNVQEAIAAVKKKYDPDGNINWTYMSDGDSDMSKDPDGNECYWIRGQHKGFHQSAGSYDGHDYYVYPDGTIKER